MRVIVAGRCGAVPGGTRPGADRRRIRGHGQGRRRDGPAARAGAQDPPDAVVVDIRMPPTHTTEGLDAAKTIKDRNTRRWGAGAVGPRRGRHYALELLETGATGTGYLLKERVADLDELTDAVRRVAVGGVVLDPSVVALLVGRQRVRNPLDDLTERERDVLAVMAEGRSNQAICERLAPEPEDRRGLRAWCLHQARALSGRRRQSAGAGGVGFPAWVIRTKSRWSDPVGPDHLSLALDLARGVRRLADELPRSTPRAIPLPRRRSRQGRPTGRRPVDRRPTGRQR